MVVTLRDGGVQVPHSPASTAPCSWHVALRIIAAGHIRRVRACNWWSRQLWWYDGGVRLTQAPRARLVHTPRPECSARRHRCRLTWLRASTRGASAGGSLPAHLRLGTAPVCRLQVLWPRKLPRHRPRRNSSSQRQPPRQSWQQRPCPALSAHRWLRLQHRKQLLQPLLLPLLLPCPWCQHRLRLAVARPRAVCLPRC